MALLIGDNVCGVDEKVMNAQQNGASGVLISNVISQSTPYSGDLPSDTTAIIPVLGISYLLGVDLSSAQTPSVSFTVDGSLETSYTSNLFADTAAGDAQSLIVVGSHLDSVPAGPGINDNGSGSAVNLELALQAFKNSLPLYSKVRFAWWGAEELGLLGSSYYVEHLTEQGNYNCISFS